MAITGDVGFLTRVDQRAVQTFGLPRQPFVPPASYAVTAAVDVAYATPLATARTSPVALVHNDSQVFGLPEQPAFPSASNALVPTNTIPFATAGVEGGAAPNQSGEHAFGFPEQLFTPAGS